MDGPRLLVREAVERDDKILYRRALSDLTDGEFVGVANFPQGFSELIADRAFLPCLHPALSAFAARCSHGVAPNSYFLGESCGWTRVLSRVMLYKKLVALSAKSTGTSHPTLHLAASVGRPATRGEETDHWERFVLHSVAIPVKAGAPERIGIVVKGAASHSLQDSVGKVLLR